MNFGKDREGKAGESRAKEMRTFALAIVGLIFGGFNHLHAQPIDPNMRIAELLQQIQQAESASVMEDEIGGALVGAAWEARGTVTEQTIDEMATLIGNSGANVRVWIARALTEIGPPARRALPSLRKAAEADEEALKQYYGIAVGPEGPYEAKTRAIEVITGNR